MKVKCSVDGEITYERMQLFSWLLVLILFPPGISIGLPEILSFKEYRFVCGIIHSAFQFIGKSSL